MYIIFWIAVSILTYTAVLLFVDIIKLFSPIFGLIVLVSLLLSHLFSPIFGLIVFVALLLSAYFIPSLHTAMRVPPRWHLSLFERIGKNGVTAKAAKSMEDNSTNDIPYGLVQDGCGSCQCYCPNCDYGKGHMTHFLSCDVKPRIYTCPACGKKYQGIIGVDG